MLELPFRVNDALANDAARSPWMVCVDHIPVILVIFFGLITEIIIGIEPILAAVKEASRIDGAQIACPERASARLAFIGP